jgi:hypothetical protein
MTRYLFALTLLAASPASLAWGSNYNNVWGPDAWTEIQNQSNRAFDNLQRQEDNRSRELEQQQRQLEIDRRLDQIQRDLNDINGGSQWKRY